MLSFDLLVEQPLSRDKNRPPLLMQSILAGRGLLDLFKPGQTYHLGLDHTRLFSRDTYACIQ